MPSADSPRYRRQPLAYCGQYRDPVCGGYPLGAGCRTYLPAQMRFAVPDALSPFGAGGLHPYVYCAGDPLNRADPSGRFPILIGVILSSLLGGSALAVNARTVQSASLLRAEMEVNVPIGLRASEAVARVAVVPSVLSIPISIAGALVAGPIGWAMVGGAAALAGLSLAAGAGTLAAVYHAEAEFEARQENMIRSYVRRLNAAGTEMPASRLSADSREAMWSDLRGSWRERRAGLAEGQAAPPLPSFEDAARMPSIPSLGIFALSRDVSEFPPAYEAPPRYAESAPQAAPGPDGLPPPPAYEERRLSSSQAADWMAGGADRDGSV